MQPAYMSVWAIKTQMCVSKKSYTFIIQTRKCISEVIPGIVQRKQSFRIADVLVLNI